MKKFEIVIDGKTYNLIIVPIGLSMANATIDIYKENIKTKKYLQRVDITAYKQTKVLLQQCHLQEQSEKYLTLNKKGITSVILKFYKVNKFDEDYEEDLYLLIKDK